MKKQLFATLLLATTAVSANAATFTFQGSDTLKGAVTDLIIQKGLSAEIQYDGGGSGKGESALVAGQQSVAPMSREMKPEAIDALAKKGQKVVQHWVGLDGLGMFVNRGNVVRSLDLAMIAKIYTCEFTRWEQISRELAPLGAINAYRRDDFSGTTSSFKDFLGVKAFGACVKIVATTDDIKAHTSNEANAIGYAGHSGENEGKNRAVAVAKDASSPAVELNVNTVRSFAYPLSRKVFVMEVTGRANAAEQKFLRWALDRRTFDRNLDDNGLYTIN